MPAHQSDFRAYPARLLMLMPSMLNFVVGTPLSSISRDDGRGLLTQPSSYVT